MKDQRIHITHSVIFVKDEFPFSEKYEGHKMIPNKHFVDAFGKLQNNSNFTMNQPDKDVNINYESPQTNNLLPIIQVHVRMKVSLPLKINLVKLIKKHA